MHLIERDSFLWNYLPGDIQNLVSDGEVLFELVEKERGRIKVYDYSFIVFPFAKAYEGFLKKFLLDSGLIKEEDYYSDDIRIGRILNPRFEKESGNVFKRICDHSQEGRKISRTLWEVWKQGRNLVFHFFPHNFRRLSFDEAVGISRSILQAMETVLGHCRV